MQNLVDNLAPRQGVNAASQDPVASDRTMLSWIQTKVSFRVNQFFQEDSLIHIVDDDPMVRSSLQFLLRSEGWKSAVWSDAESFLAARRPKVPGCLILDVQLVGMTGLDLQAKLEQLDPNFPICFISAHGEMNLAVHTMRHHAIDFMPKPVDTDRLLKNILQGSRQHWRYLVDRLCHEAVTEHWNTLTSREREIAMMIVQGELNKQIAEQLGISENTVQTHRTSCFRKLGIRTSLELARIVGRIDQR